MAQLGKCPDCNYEPISISCRACPKCGCHIFIRALGPKEERTCSNCNGISSYSCKECYGKGKAMVYQVKDFRSGEIYWDRAGYETRK